MAFESTAQTALAYVIQFIYYFAVAWVVVAAVQLMTNRFALPKKMPLRGILIAAVILTLLSALRGGPRVGSEFARGFNPFPNSGQEVQAQLVTEAEAVNQAFLAAFDLTASRDEVRSMVAAIPLDRWPANVRNPLIATIITKANRYGDLHQSIMLGQVVRTPLPAQGAQSEELRNLDETVWTPLLEAAARGDSVTLPDLVIHGTQESWLMAVTATRARIVFLDALHAAHGIDRPVFDADRDLATAFDWLEGYARDFRSGGGEPGPFVELLASLVDVTGNHIPAPHAITDALDAASAYPDLARSFLLSEWATEYVDHSTHKWLARVALGERPPTTVIRLNTYRRVLGLPIMLQEVATEARTSGAMPAWTGALAHHSASSPREILDEAERELRLLNDRYASVAAFWLAPKIDLD